MSALFFRDGSAFVGKPRTEGAKLYTVVDATCGRCGGSGNLPMFRHVEGGRCFECGGSGAGKPRTMPLYTAEKLAKLNATAAKKAATAKAKYEAEAAAREAAAEARKAGFEAEYADVLPWLRSVVNEAGGSREGFYGSMLYQAETEAVWSEAQAAAVRKAFNKAAEKAAISAKSHFVGNIGERLVFVATVERESSFYREAFGSYNGGMEEVFVTSLRDEAGNAFTVMSPRFREPVGGVFKIAGTVKAHKDYKGEAQTILTRVAVKATISDPAASPAA